MGDGPVEIVSMMEDTPMFKMRNLLILFCLLFIAIPAFAQSSTPEATPSEAFTVNLSSSAALGSFFVGPNGMTLYTFDVDNLDTSNCSGGCAHAWPALTVASASALTADPSIPGDWGTITRADDGTLQVTYNGMPLYYWFKDAAPGDTTGEGVGNTWWVGTPATVYIQRTADLGTLLVGVKGMTVYMFKNDTAGSGVSTCTGGCSTNWPAVTVAAATDILAGPNVRGIFATIDLADGTHQVTY